MFCAIFDAYPAEVIFIWKDAQEGWKVEKADRGDCHVRGYGSPLVTSGGSCQLLTDHRGFTRIARPGRPWMIGDVIKVDELVISSFDNIKTYVLAASKPDHFTEILVPGKNGDLLPLTDVNPQTTTWKLPSVKHITWIAPDGTEVGGVVELPYGYKKGDKLPLVVAIHGGPTTSTKADLEFDPHNGRLYFAAAGYAVLLPNYRGSTGYGDKFVTDLIGHENDIEVKDILAG